jgi:hypothetical protein
MLKSPTLSSEYWQSLDVGRQDVELLQNSLFETETPLTTRELLGVLVEARLREERESQERRQKDAGRLYLPRETYSAGERLVFPVFGWQQATVVATRGGANPELGHFQVIDVDFEDGLRRSFAGGLQDHVLNRESDEAPDEFPGSTDVVAEYSDEMENKLEAALRADGNLVRIAGRWFPRALLLDIGVGQLNLAEAILEVAAGEPMSTPTLMDQIELPVGVNPRLVEFSLNYALQEDPRFDEVGPAGEVLWCLRRAEPEDVQNVPVVLQYRPVDYDASVLTKSMVALDAELDDELSDLEHPAPRTEEATICLTYPHWRAGTLPISSRLQGFFPTAYESPRVRFTLVDVRSGQRMPAWVVREHKYVSGLRAWFDVHALFPGALIRVGPGKAGGEVQLQAATRRPTRDWVRTVLIGSDGGIVFAMLRQQVACDYNERMTAIVTDLDAVEKAVAQTAKYRQPFEQLVATMVRELSKLTPQGHVHAQEVYSAINILRRVPPAPLMATLASSPAFTHVGDLYFRLAGDSNQEN